MEKLKVGVVCMIVNRCYFLGIPLISICFVDARAQFLISVVGKKRTQNLVCQILVRQVF